MKGSLPLDYVRFSLEEQPKALITDVCWLRHDGHGSGAGMHAASLLSSRNPLNSVDASFEFQPPVDLCTAHIRNPLTHAT